MQGRFVFRSKYIWIAIASGMLVAGIAIGYAIFNSYNSQVAVADQQQQAMQYLRQNPDAFNQWMSQNPRYMGQWFGYMKQNPQLRQQMYTYMFQNKDFMYSMMGNQTFQNQYMGPWMMQNPNFGQQFSNQGAPPNQFNNFGGGMMGGSSNGGSGMGPGMMGGSPQESGSYNTVSIKDAAAEITLLPNGPQASKETDTITFGSPSIDLVSFAMMRSDAINSTGYNSPSSAHSSGDVFVIGGLINPTLTVKSGTLMRITLINLDEDMPHNFVITRSSPPYSTMPVMGNGGILNTMPFLPNQDTQKGNAYEYTDSVALNQAGTYWYVCTYPGHAEEGMYGKIVVQ